MLNVGEVVSPGPGRPQGVGVHDAQVVAGLEIAAGAHGDLRIVRIMQRNVTESVTERGQMFSH